MRDRERERERDRDRETERKGDKERRKRNRVRERERERERESSPTGLEGEYQRSSPHCTPHEANIQLTLLGVTVGPCTMHRHQSVHPERAYQITPRSLGAQAGSGTELRLRSHGRVRLRLWIGMQVWKAFEV